MPRVRLTEEQKQLSKEKNRQNILARYYRLREVRIANGEVIKRWRPEKVITEERQRILEHARQYS